MSNFLNDISLNKISIEEGLQRLLIIANKTGNKELSKWCVNELNGYKRYDELPSYRIFKNRNIVYSGINGKFQVNNIPLGPGYLSEDTLRKIEKIGLYENIAKVEENMKLKENMYRDLTALAGEVYTNTKDELIGIGVTCTSIQQLIPNSLYSSIYSNVKTRIINLLCLYETAKVDIDNLDIKQGYIASIKEKNSEIYKTIVSEGTMYTFVPKEKKFVWNIIVPIAIGILTGVLVYLITNFLFK